jgi:hypothetical protein
MGALDTFPITGDLTNAGGVSSFNIKSLVGSGLQSVSSVVVTPRTDPFGFLAFFVQDTAPAPNDPMPGSATYALAGTNGSMTIPFDPNAMAPSKTNGNLYYAWSTSDTVYLPAIGGSNPPRSLGLVFNAIVQGASFYAPRPYYAATGSFAAAASATDVCTIAGAAGRIIDITAVTISADSTLTNAILIGARSAANTGGTSIAVTPMPGDRIQAASLATVLKYTANPAALGAVYGVAGVRFGVQPSFPQRFVFAPGTLTLRAAADLAVVNMSSVATPGNLSITWEYTEEFANP